MFVPLVDEVLLTGCIATIDYIPDRGGDVSLLAHLPTHDPLTELPTRTVL
jgi:hypothetical protein